MFSDFNEFIEEQIKKFGSEELFEVFMKGTLSQKNLAICKLIVNNNITLLTKYFHDTETTLQSLNEPFKYDNLEGKLRDDMGFDVLIFAIKSKVPLEMIKYIVETTPYKNLNY